jgi:hypothetical protein
MTTTGMTFMGDGHQWVAPAEVRPEDLPDDPLDDCETGADTPGSADS